MSHSLLAKERQRIVSGVLNQASRRQFVAHRKSHSRPLTVEHHEPGRGQRCYKPLQLVVSSATPSAQENDRWMQRSGAPALVVSPRTVCKLEFQNKTMIIGRHKLSTTGQSGHCFLVDGIDWAYRICSIAERHDHHEPETIRVRHKSGSPENEKGRPHEDEADWNGMPEFLWIRPFSRNLERLLHTT